MRLERQPPKLGFRTSDSLAYEQPNYDEHSDLALDILLRDL